MVDIFKSGCFDFTGVGHLHRIHSSLTKVKYHCILQTHAQPSGLNVEKDSYYSRIMRPNTPQSCDRTTWRRKGTVQPQGSPPPLSSLLFPNCIAPFTLLFQCGNHAQILHVAVCVKVTDAERGDRSTLALIHLQRRASVCVKRQQR